MANKPTIFGFDDAGCKWETMHKEDITSNINSAKTELNNNINSAKTELNGNIDSAKNELYVNMNTVKAELNGNINSVLARKVATCKRAYTSSQELDLYSICTINVGEMIFYELYTSSGSLKLKISNEHMGVTYFAFGVSSAGVLKQTLIGGFNKTDTGSSISQSINDANVARIFVIAIRTQ